MHNGNREFNTYINALSVRVTCLFHRLLDCFGDEFRGIGLFLAQSNSQR
jgi:hypothetical protein